MESKSRRETAAAWVGAPASLHGNLFPADTRWTVRKPSVWRSLGFALACALGALALLLLYLRLPYRSSWLTPTTAKELATAPNPRFRLGPLEWRVDEYSSAVALEPFRREFRAHCEGLRGLPAGLCVSNVMAQQFVFGESKSEFFDSQFDPADHLRRHTGGAPGHCVNRSAIMASELLAVGIPARVTQLYPADGSGHTVVEVWDDRFGWTLIDPSLGGVMGDGFRPTSALHLSRSPDSAAWFKLGLAPTPSSLAEPARRHNPESRLFSAQIVYPDPWLHLRVGRRSAPWPFRGSFAYFGTEGWSLGRGHAILRLSIVACSLGAVVFLIVALRRHRVYAADRA